MAFSKRQSMIRTYRQFMEMCMSNKYSRIRPRFVYEKIAGFGTALDEKIQGIGGVKNLLKLQKRQSKGLKISWKIKPVSHYTSEDGNTAVFADDAYLTIKAGKEIIEMYLRISVVLNYHNKQWKVIHWHGSKPEQVESEKDTWGVVSWKQRAQELEQLVAEKTADLVEKNRELEIEAALERVRSRSLAMHRSEELKDVVSVVFNTLKDLGINLERGAAIINIFTKGEKDHLQWIADPTQAYARCIKMIHHENALHQAIWAARQKGVKFYSKAFTKKEKDKFFKHAFTKTDYRFIPDELKAALLKAKQYSFSIAFQNNIGIGVADATGRLFNEEEKSILIRLTHVFEQAYTRFLDLQRAEAQAREAQIEAALERIRSKSLAMHSSDQLQEVINTVFDNLLDLGIEAATVTMLIPQSTSKDIDVWIQNTDRNYSAKALIPYFNNRIGNDFIKAWKNKIKLFTGQYTKKEKDDWFKFLFKDPRSLKNIPQARKQYVLNGNAYSFSISHHTHTGIYMGRYNSHAFSDSDNEILKRVAFVFDQAYTRFLDLQKAEAQAREAQIELAIERVRARALAMHHSEELGQLVSILFDELVKLDLVLARCIIWIINPKDSSAQVWIANSEDRKTSECYHVQQLDHPYYKSILNAWKKKTVKWVYQLKGIEKKSIDKLLLTQTELSHLPKAVKKGIAEKKEVMVAGSFSNFGFIEASGPVHYTDEQMEILSRFSKVFDQSYTRFLDLQKAEAQAREAQIEAALERVRSRSMAMHKTDELEAVSIVLYEELKKLGFQFVSCGFTIVMEKEALHRVWNHDFNKGQLSHFQMSLKGDKVLAERHKVWKEGATLFLQEIQGKILNKHLANGIPEEFKNEKDLAYRFNIPDPCYFTLANFSKGYLHVLSRSRLPNEHQNMLVRFSKVFEQSYIRYLDLQKAEAQAREAQIEAALERVRSRTMAMHKSEELKQVIKVIYDQLIQLNFNVDNAGFFVDPRESNDYNAWDASEDLPVMMHTPYFDHLINREYIDHRDNGPELFAKAYSFEEKNSWWKEVFKRITGVPEEIKAAALKIRLEVPGLALSRVLTQNIGIYVLNFSGTLYSDDENATLLRFARAFEQSYTRFNDLKHAEAQAREAQIEAGLERVRSKTMAMHNSQDVGNTVASLFDELVALGLEKSARCGIGILDESDTMELWTASTNDQGELILSIGHLNMTLHPLLKGVKKTWSSKKESFTYELQGADLINYFNALNDYPDYTIYIDTKTLPEKIIHNSFYFTEGLIYCFTTNSISGDLANVVKRFAGVFGQTYKRYLDLQKAEAQAREAQIQLALERIRAKAIGMHHSNELHEVLTVLFQQYDFLDIRPVTTILNLIDLSKNQFTHFSTGKKGKRGVLTQTMALDASNTWKSLVDEWKFKEPQSISTAHYPVEAIPHVFDLFKEMRMSVPAEDVPQVDDFPNGMFQVVANCKFGNIGFMHTREATTEEKDIVSRFALEFERLYQRFLDLQKAEAQTREAQIEVAVERVRAKALAMHKSEEIIHVANALRQGLDGLQIPGSASATITLQQEHSNLRLWDITSVVEQEGGFRFSMDIMFSLDGTKPDDWIRRVWDPTEKYFVFRQDVKDIKRTVAWIRQYQPEFAENAARWLKANKVKNVWHPVVQLSHGKLSLDLLEEPVGDVESVLTKMGAAFDLAYKRFLDLQKAEAQAREAQIEAALERVRSRSLAMHKSEDLPLVVHEVFDRLNDLELNIDAAGIIILNKVAEKDECWFAIPNAQYPKGLLIPHKGTKILDDVNLAMKNKAAFVNQLYSFEEKNKFFQYLFEFTDFKYLPDNRKKYLLECDSLTQSNFYETYSAIQLNSYSGRNLSDSNIQVATRFAKVFEQAYTRFLDLQKAEAQAREAQIEASLERVRSRSLAMHKSEELNEIVSCLYHEMETFGFARWACTIQLFDAKTEKIELWLGDFLKPEYQRPYYWYGKENRTIKKLWLAWESKSPTQIFHFKGKDKRDFDNYLFTKTDYKDFPDEVKTQTINQEEVYFSLAYFKFGYLVATDYAQPLAENFDLLVRFAKVFEQSYTRFLDLQKAEAQAREAQIEAALERLRSRTMAMQQSSELNDISVLLYKEIMTLSVSNFFNCGYFEMHEDEEVQYGWLTREDGTSLGKLKFPLKGDHTLDTRYDAWKEQKPLFHQVLDSIQMKKHISFISPHYNNKEADEVVKLFPNPTIFYNANFKYGYLHFNTGTYLDDEGESILIRFTQVFAQTYTRFLDLQKAEAQAKEAQIEAALERVRGKAMAMHSSQDLADTIGTFYQQLKLFNLVPRRCGVGLLNKQNKEGEVFTWNTTENGESLELVGTIRMDTHPVLENVYNYWITKTDYHPVLRGNEIKEYHEVIRPQIAFPEHQSDEVLYGYFFMFEEGGVYAWKEIPLKEDEITIYRRFTSVLSLTYKRYKDLRDAEARAKEAVKQAALDRMRAEIASMRTIEDLDRITPLIWRELTTLGITFVRCGVFIMDEEKEIIHTFLSTPDGKAIAAFHLPYGSTTNLTEAIEAWRQHQRYVTHWVNKDFQSQADILVRQGSIANREQYLSSIPKDGIYLHFLPFLQGMLYVGNTTQLNNEQVELIQSVADAFSTAYARYEDFNKLEAAKKQVDKTLTDLKQAQQQLVQSEKMASLGELTAGIAHEIQNPLNFVNNFSEVNKELLAEMEEAVKKGDLEEAISLANDISANQEKINHHGKRAEGIVKGMLQHSRGSSGQKELTNINDLCDEYLRLSYHGYRAKDKTFNAKFETDFDSTLPKINIVPQDIGRVILNLINNAFYAVSEKLKVESQKSDSVFEPTVMVSTRNLGDKIEISVKDNGNGIPDSIKEKIFQPFFTTKPTGQGTGLGLSLSYDIITKGHGGEIKLITGENAGTEFVILLPAV